MLEKDRDGNSISTFPPCYAVQMIFTAMAPRLIQYTSRNVHDKNGALKQLYIVYLSDIPNKALCVIQNMKKFNLSC